MTRSSTNQTPVKETVREVPKEAPKTPKQVRIEEPKSRQIPLEEIWTQQELDLARAELQKSTQIVSF